MNGIGASASGAIVSSLASGGRMAVYGVAFGGREFPIDLMDLYRRRLEIIGVNSVDVDAAGGAVALNKLRPLFESGALDKPRIAERYSLDQFAVAYERMRAGAGKIVFQIN